MKNTTSSITKVQLLKENIAESTSTITFLILVRPILLKLPGKSALKTLEINMHRNSRNLFYYDQIGNISTSNAWKDSEGLHMRIKPRFPLFGGWKTDWYQGYDLATKFALFNDKENSDKFVFDYSFCFPYNSIIADHYKLKIVLPEGAKNYHVLFIFNK